MKIILTDKTNKVNKEIGQYPQSPIPRIGEKVVTGTDPAPAVIMVGYDYENDVVMVVVDGFILN